MWTIRTLLLSRGTFRTLWGQWGHLFTVDKRTFLFGSLMSTLKEMKFDCRNRHLGPYVLRVLNILLAWYSYFLQMGTFRTPFCLLEKVISGTKWILDRGSLCPKCPSQQSYPTRTTRKHWLRGQAVRVPIVRVLIVRRPNCPDNQNLAAHLTASVFLVPAVELLLLLPLVLPMFPPHLLNNEPLAAVEHDRLGGKGA